MNDSTWIWISGSNTINQRAVYGEKGKASIENVPGARRGAVGCFDSLREELWVFGGNGYGTTGPGLFEQSLHQSIPPKI